MGAILRVYIDTSVIGGCLDPEWQEHSLKLMEAFDRGEMIALLSDVTLDELEPAPAEVKKILERTGLRNAERLSLTEDAKQLAEAYINERTVAEKQKIVAEKRRADARHIALATINRADLVVSWNFDDIVQFSRIRLFNAVNLKMGYPMLEIRAPSEVVGI